MILFKVWEEETHSKTETPKDEEHSYSEQCELTGFQMLNIWQ